LTRVVVLWLRACGVVREIKTQTSWRENAWQRTCLFFFHPTRIPRASAALIQTLALFDFGKLQ
jgi:hypothetical protein